MKDRSDIIAYLHQNFSARRRADGDPNDPCPRCHLRRTVEGHDPCIAHLPGVDFACCGHGTGPGYISFANGITIRFPYLYSVERWNIQHVGDATTNHPSRSDEQPGATQCPNSQSTPTTSTSLVDPPKTSKTPE